MGQSRRVHSLGNPPAKDVTVTVNRRPPPIGVTCAPATGRRGRHGSQTYNHTNRVRQPRLQPIKSPPPPDKPVSVASMNVEKGALNYTQGSQ